MAMSRREFLAAAAAAPLAAPARIARGAQEPAPPPVKIGRQLLNLGETPDRDGFLYVPTGYKPDTRAPLLLMLHGAGSTALNTSYAFPLADEFGILLVAPDSRDERTWDGVLLNWGPDVEFITAALQQTMGRVAVDRSRIGVCGFSDGASYALGFGISFGDQ